MPALYQCRCCAQFFKRHNRGESTITTNPHLRRVSYMLLLEFERDAIENIVADVLWVLEHLLYGPARPLPVQVCPNSAVIEQIGDLLLCLVSSGKNVVNFPDNCNLGFRPGHKHDSIGLKALSLHSCEQLFGTTILRSEERRVGKVCS